MPLACLSNIDMMQPDLSPFMYGQKHAQLRCCPLVVRAHSYLFPGPQKVKEEDGVPDKNIILIVLFLKYQVTCMLYSLRNENIVNLSTYVFNTLGLNLFLVELGCSISVINIHHFSYLGLSAVCTNFY